MTFTGHVDGLIVADNTYNSVDNTSSRAWGSHRLATHLRSAGYRIEVIDYCLRYTLDELCELTQRLIGSKTVFLGIGSNLFLDRDSFNHYTQWVKASYPHVAIVLGGNQLLTRTIAPVDYAIEGNAENAILVLLEYLRGIRTVDQVTWTPTDQPFRLINALVNHNQVDTQDLTIHYLPQDFIQPNETLGVETARGCIFKCSFCSYPLIGKKKLDYVRNVDTIRDEFVRNYELWGTTRYFILEDTFNDRLDKLRQLHEAITRLPFRIEFVTYARLDLILAQPESAKLLHEMGLRGVHFGIETFSPSAARLIGKGTSAERIKEGLLWWRDQTPGTITSTSLITGLPQDHTDHFETADWFIKNRAVNYWTWQPLWLNNMTSSLHSSEFSRNYRMYGLAPMTDDEIQAEIQVDLDQGQPPPYQMGNHKGYQNKMTHWKNTRTGDNWFRAMRLAVRLNRYSHSRNISPWNAFDWASLGYTIDEMGHWGWYDVVPHVPEADIKSRINSRIDQYKQLKLAYDYAAYYAK
jgi:hypothetical protein